MSCNITRADLNASSGSETWTRHPLAPYIILSEGAMYLMDRGLAWLFDAIASHEMHNDKIKRQCAKNEGFDYLHFWTLDVDLPSHTAVLTCREDSGLPAVVTQGIPYTDCPLSEVKVYAGNDGPGTLRKLFMPSEY